MKMSRRVTAVSNISLAYTISYATQVLLQENEYCGLTHSESLLAALGSVLLWFTGFFSESVPPVVPP